MARINPNTNSLSTNDFRLKRVDQPPHRQDLPDRGRMLSYKSVLLWYTYGVYILRCPDCHNKNVRVDQTKSILSSDTEGISCDKCGQDSRPRYQWVLFTSYDEACAWSQISYLYCRYCDATMRFNGFLEHQYRNHLGLNRGEYRCLVCNNTLHVDTDMHYVQERRRD